MTRAARQGRASRILPADRRTRRTPDPAAPPVGALLAVGSGLAYAVTVVMGRDLAEAGVPSEAALGLRFTLGALILFVVLAARRLPLLPVRGERLAAILLGGIGYAVESTCFYLALERGSAAAVGLLFYSYPAIVAGLELVTGSVRPTARLLAAVGLSAGGVVVVVATGGAVTITAVGAVLALAAALTFSLYFLAAHRLIRRTEPLVNATWVSLGAGLSLSLRGLLAGRMDYPASRTVEMLGYGIANAFAFALMFAALRRLGPTRTSLLLNVEVAGTVVLAAVFLGETLRATQLLGGAGIAAGAVLATLAGSEPAEPAPP